LRSHPHGGLTLRFSCGARSAFRLKANEFLEIREWSPDALSPQIE
jgi:hypothetical protein